MKNVTAAPNDEVKQASLEALGYTCEELDEDAMPEAQSNLVLTAIVQGMRKEEQNVNVKRAAAAALLNALEFARRNFADDRERSFLMQIVCEAAQSSDNILRVIAFQCLVKIALEYYDHLAQYMQFLLNVSISFWPCLIAIDLLAAYVREDQN